MTASDRRQKLYEKIIGKRCKNVRFQDICKLLEMYGWVVDRVARNSHYIYVHPDYEGIVNIPRPHDGPTVKLPYCRNALRAIQELVNNDE